MIRLLGLLLWVGILFGGPMVLLSLLLLIGWGSWLLRMFLQKEG